MTINHQIWLDYLIDLKHLFKTLKIRKFATKPTDSLQNFKMKLNEVRTGKAFVTISLRNFWDVPQLPYLYYITQPSELEFVLFQ